MLPENETKLIENLKECKKIINNECEECSEISSCNVVCVWHQLKMILEVIFQGAETKTKSDIMESLF